MKLRPHQVLSSSLLSLAIGCGDSEVGTARSACAASGLGTLTIHVTGLPDGVAAKITVTGASGSQEVTASGNVTLTGGAYNVAVATVIPPAPIVRGVYYTTRTTITDLCVEDGKTATAEVVYAILPTSNKLWATNGNGAAELLGFAASSLAASGTPTATVTGNVEIPAGIAFDKEGGLWAVIGAAGGKQLAHYPATAFATSGPRTADITITGDALNGGVPSAGAIAFDKDGSLWVSNLAANKILRYGTGALIASGSPAPSITISNVKAPGSLAFDKDGNLWVSETGENRVVEYVASRLGASTADPPNVALSAQTPLPTVVPHQAPLGLAFDASNNLWANFNGSAFVRITPSERTATATLTPTVQLHLSVDALAEGVAFDESGSLWFAYSQGKIARLGASQLAASGDVTPEIILTSPSVAYGANVAFYPAAANLPIFSRLP